MSAIIPLFGLLCGADKASCLVFCRHQRSTLLPARQRSTSQPRIVEWQHSGVAGAD